LVGARVEVLDTKKKQNNEMSIIDLVIEYNLRGAQFIFERRYVPGTGIGAGTGAGSGTVIQVGNNK